MDGSHPDSFHALHEEDGGESSARYLVRDVAFSVLDADRRELLGQSRITEISLFQLALEEPFDLSLPIPALGSHLESPDSVRDSSYLMIMT